MAARLNHRFSIVMREIETYITQRHDRPFTDAVYALVGPGTLSPDDARLLEWTWDIRNLLAHTVVDGHDPVEASPATIRSLERIRTKLTGRAPTVQGMLGPVATVGPGCSVAVAAATMSSNDYSCLPVEIRGEVIGAIDADLVLHWLAEGLGTEGIICDATVGELRRDWPDPPIDFMRADALQRTVVSRFEVALRDGAPLAAVLLTPDGSARGPLEGIVTPWDLASLVH